MLPTPTIATLPSLLVMVGQGRALDTASRCAPRSFQHSVGHRARQRTGGRFARKLKTLRINWHLRRAARLLWLSSRHHEAVKRLRRRIAP